MTERDTENDVTPILDAITNTRNLLRQLQQLSQSQPHRTISLAVTKVEEAAMWLENRLRLD